MTARHEQWQKLKEMFESGKLCIRPPSWEPEPLWPDRFGANAGDGKTLNFPPRTRPPPAKDPKNEKNPEPVKAKRWRNLYFRADGKYGLGANIWPSEKLAVEIADNMVEEWRLLRVIGLVQVVGFSNGVQMTFDEFSHTIAIPWDKSD